MKEALNNFKGIPFGELSQEEKQEVYNHITGYYCGCDVSGNEIEAHNYTGECIVDFDNGLSITGYKNTDYIFIEDEAVFYDAMDGLEVC